MIKPSLFSTKIHLIKRSFAMSKRTGIKSRRPDSGYFLIEAMLAVALLSTIVYGYGSLITQSNTVSLHTQRYGSAAELSNMVMEELSYSYITEQILSPGDHIRYYDNQFRMVTTKDYIYKVTWVVTENEPKPGVLNIKLITTWLEGARENSVSFETLR